jgi:hypothetical protein
MASSNGWLRPLRRGVQHSHQLVRHLGVRRVNGLQIRNGILPLAELAADLGS